MNIRALPGVLVPSALLATTVLCGACLLAPAAHAQLSAAQILEQLKPKGDVLKGNTRGIRPITGAATPAPAQSSSASAVASAPRPPVRQASATPAAGAPAPAATAAAAEPSSIDLSVQFGNGSADLTPQATKVLDELGKALSSPELAGSHFRIEGHTDTVGSADLNRALSEKRAASVVSYLSGRYAVSSARLEAVGMGEEGLLVPTPDQTAEPRNRRVHVVNLGG